MVGRGLAKLTESSSLRLATTPRVHVEAQPLALELRLVTPSSQATSTTGLRSRDLERLIRSSESQRPCVAATWTARRTRHSAPAELDTTRTRSAPSSLVVGLIPVSSRTLPPFEGDEIRLESVEFTTDVRPRSTTSACSRRPTPRPRCPGVLVVCSDARHRRGGSRERGVLSKGSIGPVLVRRGPQPRNAAG